jgi:citrate lyase subunit beta / citryl-CoA lyase
LCAPAHTARFETVFHPAHVVAVHAAFTPSAEAVAWAQQVRAAFESAPGAGVVTIAGKMIDKPHLVKVRNILELATANPPQR